MAEELGEMDNFCCQNRWALARVLVNWIGALALVTLGPGRGMAEDSAAVLYSFCAQGGTRCTDGFYPQAGLIDVAENLYGTTVEGGTGQWGTVFRLVPNAAKTLWTEQVLYNFCTQAGCTDGENPEAGVIIDGKGNLYGTTRYGGAHQWGTVFMLTPNKAKTQWTEQVLYSFCEQPNCADGRYPYGGGLVMDASGTIYGTTQTGGVHDGGTVFALIPNISKTQWTETVLYSFCAQGGQSCTDGANPLAGLIMDTSGRLYGTTTSGGVHPGIYGDNAGTVFALIPNTARTRWTETVLYSFCAQRFCSDGENPQAGLIMDPMGNLYGTTSSGGANYQGFGTVFQLTPNATKSRWTEAVLYRFCSQLYCFDGESPAGLIMGIGGNLYGTTYAGGGAGGGGTVFVLIPNGAKTKWTQTVLHSFCARGGASCTDGLNPDAGLVMDRTGRLYGVTQAGGGHVPGNGFNEGGRTVFGLKP